MIALTHLTLDQAQCESVSVPPVERVVWKYKDYPVNTRTSHYQVVTKRSEDRTVSTLVISNTVLADFGTYNCTVRNSYGEDFQLIEIVRKGEYLSIFDNAHHCMMKDFTFHVRCC